MPVADYASAERFILSREFFGMKLGLENISQFLDSIGNPQHAYATIHVAGTNGKGSTVAMLGSVLRAAGYRTGVFTSPHLVTFRERVQINGRNVPPAAVAAFVNRHQKALRKRKLSFFEVTTALALEHFKRAGVDIAVIETGLGGRLDATNVLEPLVTVTTEISYDHMEILGRRLDTIAGEKAGIIKPGTPHVASPIPAAAARVIERRCAKLGAPLVWADSSLVHSRGNDRFDFRFDGLKLGGLSTSLPGNHQVSNATTVLTTIALLRQFGWKIPQAAIRTGLATTDWPGRFQIVRRRGLPTLVFDVSHNASGVQTFVETFQARFPNRRAPLITGFVKRKEHQRMFDLLSDIASEYLLVPLGTRRSVDVDELIGAINWRGVPFRKFGSLSAARNRLLKTAGPDDIGIVIGSHYLVGEYFKRFGR